MTPRAVTGRRFASPCDIGRQVVAVLTDADSLRLMSQWDTDVLPLPVTAAAVEATLVCRVMAGARVRGEDGAWYRPGTRRWVGVLRLWAEDIAAWAATAAISKEGR